MSRFLIAATLLLVAADSADVVPVPPATSSRQRIMTTHVKTPVPAWKQSSWAADVLPANVPAGPGAQ